MLYQRFMQAIALSLQDSAGFLNVGKRVPYQNSNTKMVEGDISERKGNASIEEDTGKRKRKKPVRLALISGFNGKKCIFFCFHFLSSWSYCFFLLVRRSVVECK